MAKEDKATSKNDADASKEAGTTTINSATAVGGAGSDGKRPNQGPAKAGGGQPGKWRGNGPNGPNSWAKRKALAEKAKAENTQPTSTDQEAKPAAPQPAKAKPAHPSVQILPLAQPAVMKQRHWGLLFSFLGCVVLPLVAAAYYLWFVSVDQYASTTGFTVRKEESGSATDILGGLAQFAGGGGSGDADVLYEFIQSQDMVEKVAAKIDLVDHYSAHWGDDPAFAIWPDADIEDLVWYWQRILRISYDQSTGLINLQVLAFDPATAQGIAKEVVAQSQKRINELNSASRNDMMRYANLDLQEALSRLKIAREALTQFRTTTQIVDPTADIQGRMGVLNNLQQQLAEALIEYDLLLETSNQNDPRLAQAQRKIDVIQARIKDERETFASDKILGGEDDYPTLMAEFESLTLDREFAEETYRAALAAVEIARANSSRQSRYLATYIHPTLAQSSEYPQRIVWFGLATLFLIMVWSIFALIYYSVRDRR